METNLIKETIWKGSQSVNYECIIKAESRNRVYRTESLRVSMKRDSYDDQSFWRVEAWRQNGWVFITSLPFDDAKSNKVSYYGNDDDSHLDLFRQDRDRLLDYAYAVLF